MNKETITITRTVERQHLASVMKSGSLDVLATPQMIAWMEEAACLCLNLDPKQTSVGISINVSHEAPSAAGAMIEIQAMIEKMEGKKINYFVQAKEGERIIGQGKHTRFIVDGDKFMQKVYKNR